MQDLYSGMFLSLCNSKKLRVFMSIVPRYVPYEWDARETASSIPSSPRETERASSPRTPADLFQNMHRDQLEASFKATAQLAKESGALSEQIGRLKARLEEISHHLRGAEAHIKKLEEGILNLRAQHAAEKASILWKYRIACVGLSLSLAATGGLAWRLSNRSITFLWQRM